MILSRYIASVVIFLTSLGAQEQQDKPKQEMAPIAVHLPAAKPAITFEKARWLLQRLGADLKTYAHDERTQMVTLLEMVDTLADVAPIIEAGIKDLESSAKKQQK